MCATRNRCNYSDLSAVLAAIIGNVSKHFEYVHSEILETSTSNSVLLK
jgi:hypothetical protein